MSSVVVNDGTTALTWDNNDFTWDTLSASLTWNTAETVGTTVTVTYNLALTETFEKVTTSTREFTETIGLSDSFSNSTTKEIIESLVLSSRLVRGSSSVIYDVALRSAGTMNLNDIRTIARQAQVAGYEPGVEFLPGDYDFQEAIIGLVLTNNTGTKIGFKEIDVYTDTPDVIDRGTVEITNSGSSYDPTDGYTTVTLNKEYHTMPNITVTAAGGTDLAEAMLDPNGFSQVGTVISFRVKLVKSTSNNYVDNTTLVLGGGTTTPVTGTLYWKAVGY